MRKTLSVVYATFNEEKNLPKSLDSIKDIADEIIIVDGTSTDDTIKIAKKYGARIKVTTNKPIFHINKQIAIDMAKKDWVLQMDADEHVSEEMKREIKNILRSDSKEFNGYWIPRKNWFLGRFLMKGGQYPDYTIRLYKRGKGRLPQKDVHEQAEVEGKVGYLKSALLHYPYANFKHYLKKWMFYNNLFATQIKEDQEDKTILQKPIYALIYLLIKPAHWLFTTFIRHKGFVDGWQGFTFSLFSALRFPVSYIKYAGLYKFLFWLIILVSAVIRLWNFPTRWGLGGDDGRDAMIALEALRRHELPAVGSFSSAGPFVFGGIYYWVIMFSYLVMPFFVYAPWILMEALSITTVGLFMYLGKLLKNEKFSIIMGLLAITSPQLVVRALSLGQHTFVATFSALSIISFILLWQKKKLIYGSMLGFWIGLSLSFHYQSINLLVFIPLVFLVLTLPIKKRAIAFGLTLVGFLIPLLPLLIWDAQQGFANTRNLLDYFLIAQYRLYVPNSWKLFILSNIPAYWSFVVGNFWQVGLVIFFGSTSVFFYSAIKRKISALFALLGFVFLFLIFINRFYHGERSEGYMLYILPFILIFTSYFLYFLYSQKIKILKTFAVLFILLITAFNLVYVWSVVNYKSPVGVIENAKNFLYTKYPDLSFSVYDYNYKLYSTSMPLSLLLAFEGRESSKGKKIGVSCSGRGCPIHKNIIYKDILLIDLDREDPRALDPNKKIWINVNQPSVYNDLIGWLSNHNLKSSLDLGDYLRERFNI